MAKCAEIVAMHSFEAVKKAVSDIEDTIATHKAPVQYVHPICSLPSELTGSRVLGIRLGSMVLVGYGACTVVAWAGYKGVGRVLMSPVTYIGERAR
jgi:hypothetical protein